MIFAGCAYSSRTAQLRTSGPVMTQHHQRATSATEAVEPCPAPSGGCRTSRCGSARHLNSIGDLARKAAKGDEGAWRELVRQFGPMVFGVARRAGLNAADAADVQQATWLQLVRYGDQVRDPDRIGAWLATTARRQSRARGDGQVPSTLVRRSGHAGRLGHGCPRRRRGRRCRA